MPETQIYNVEMPKELHIALKIQAAMKGITMNELCVNILTNGMNSISSKEEKKS